MSFKYQVNGHTVEFAQEPSEADIDEAAGQLGPAAGRQISSIPESEFQPKNVALETAKGTLGTIGSSAGRAIKGMASMGNMFDVAKSSFKALAHPVDSVREIGQYAKDRYGGMNQIADTVATDPVGFVGDVAGAAGLAGGALRMTGNAGLMKAGSFPAVEKAGAKIGEGIKSLKPQVDVDKIITNSVTTAIRPTIAKKQFGSQLTQYNNKAVAAVKDIVANKDKLGLTDEMGNSTPRVPGSLNPNETLKETVNSIDGLKDHLFQQWNDAAQQTGDAGVRISGQDVSRDLFAEFNKSKYNLNPAIKQKAAMEMHTFTQAGDITPSDILSHLKTINQRLTSYFKTGIYETGKNQDVDAFVARTLNDAMDKAIDSATGAQYKELRQRYSNLKAIEGDLVKRTGIDARKNPKGFFDLGHIWADGQIVRGLINLNPGEVASGLTQKGVATWYKNLNNPNRIMAKMFKTVDKHYQPPAKSIKPPTGQVPPTPPSSTAPVTPTPTTPAPNIEYGRKAPGELQTDLAAARAKMADMMKRAKSRKPKYTKDNPAKNY